MIELITIQRFFILFMFYSLCGWIIEVFLEYMNSKKLINRGFLIGPICPVYGSGAILITILLTNYSKDLFVVFGLSIILCGALEYFTSYILEKLFNARWWDYSNERFNIKGRICLDNLILFGIAGVLIVLLLNPWINSIIGLIPQNVLSIVFYCTIVIFIIDIVASLSIIKNIRIITDNVTNQFKDSTEEISKKVREKILEKSAMYRRILEAFPHVFADKVKQGKEKFVHVASELRTTAIEAKDKTIANINNAKEKANYDLKKSKRLTKIRINKMKRTISKSKIMTIARFRKEKELKNEEDNNNNN